MSKVKVKNDMTKGKEWKLILLFTIPLMIGNIVQQMYNVVDGIIVGNYVGETSFAAVATSGPLTLLYLALAFGLSVGVSIVTSQYFGAGKKDELPVAIDTALLLLGACGLIFTFVGILLSPYILKEVLSVPDAVYPAALVYIRIFSFGLVFQFLYNCIAAILRSFGDSKATLYFLIVGAVLNAILSVLFVLVFKWGIAGAALGTVIAQSTCTFISYMYLRKYYPFIKGGKHWDTKLALTMTKLGLPIAAQMCIISFGNGAMQRLVNGFETTTQGIVAAYGAASRLDSIIFAPMSSFQAGLSNFTGQNLGAGKIDRVRRGHRSALIMSVSCTIVVSIVYGLIAETVVGFFGLSDNSLVIGVEIAHYFVMFYWILSCNMMFSGVLQGAGDTVVITLASLTSLVVRVVSGYTLAHFGLLGYSAAWVPVPLGWVCWSAIIYSRFFSGKWKDKVLVGNLNSNEAEGAIL